MGSSYYQTGAAAKTQVGTTISTVGTASAVGGCVVPSSQVGGAATWPANNRALYVPFVIEQTVTVKQMWTYNGGTASGKVDIGIYDNAGARLVSSGGAVDQTGTSTLQAFDLTDTVLTPELYYFAMMLSSTVGTVFRGTINVVLLNTLGVKEEATAGSLPATATMSAPSSSFMPVFGASTVALI